MAIDGNPTGTSWTTEHYDSETFAGTKTGPDPGVGIYVTSKAREHADQDGRPDPHPRLDAQIFAADGGPAGRDRRMGRTGRRSEERRQDRGNHSSHLGSAAKYFLIWFTKASPAGDQEGRYQVEISDIKLFE